MDVIPAKGSHQSPRELMYSNNNAHTIHRWTQQAGSWAAYYGLSLAGSTPPSLSDSVVSHWIRLVATIHRKVEFNHLLFSSSPSAAMNLKLFKRDFFIIMPLQIRLIIVIAAQRVSGLKTQITEWKCCAEKTTPTHPPIHPLLSSITDNCSHSLTQLII